MASVIATESLLSAGAAIGAIIAACALRLAVKKRSRRRVWLRRVFQRRAKLGCYHSLVRELQLEDVEAYRCLMRIDVDTFNDILQLIEYISYARLAAYINTKDKILSYNSDTIQVAKRHTQRSVG